MQVTPRPAATGIFAPEPSKNGQSFGHTRIGKGPDFLKMEKVHTAIDDRVSFTSASESGANDAPDLVVNLSHGQMRGNPDLPSIDISIRQESTDAGLDLQFASRVESLPEQTWDSDIHHVRLSRHVQSGAMQLAAFGPEGGQPMYIAHL